MGRFRAAQASSALTGSESDGTLGPAPRMSTSQPRPPLLSHRSPSVDSSPVSARGPRRAGNRLTRTLPVYWGLLRSESALFWGVVAASLGIVATETLSIGLVLPLLQSTEIGRDVGSDIPLVAGFSNWFRGFGEAARIRLVAAGLVVVIALRMAMLSLFNYLGIALRLRIVRRLQRRALEQVLAVQASYVSTRRQGELDEILSHHIGQIGSMVDNSTRAIGLLATLAVYGLLMLWLSPWLTLVTVLILLTLLLAVWFRVALPLELKAWRLRESAVVLHSFLLETLAGLRTIQLFGQEHRRRARFAELHDAHFRERVALEQQISLVRPAFEVANMLTLGLLLVVASLFLPEDPRAWIGELLVFLAILVRLMGPVAQVVQALAVMIRNEPALDSVHGFLDEAGKPYRTDGPQPYSGLSRELRFEQVVFRYAPTEPDVLRGLDLAIPAGRFTAVVGASGAGKSTLVNLIARLADCQAGRVLADGVDVRELRLQDWHGALSVVSQDVFLFNDTVAENLRFARPEASDAALREAARMAGADAFIAALPLGYDTPLGDRGARLSGGQRQRIAIARALLAGPGLLLLDEATSELDAHNERALKTRLRALCPRWTILAVAHRLSSIREADNILVLDRGRLVEQGTHEELLGRDGHYRRLVQAQQGVPALDDTTERGA